MPRATKKRVSMTVVAEEAGVSVAAVSMALGNSPQISDETKRLVKATCKKLGYQPKQRRGGSGPAGRPRYGLMVIGRSLRDDVVMPLVNDLVALATRSGTRLEVGSIPDVSDAGPLDEQLVDFCGNLDGVVLTGTVDSAVHRRVLAMNIHHVVLGNLKADRPGAPMAVGCPTVTCDGMAMGRSATHWLMGRGRSRVAFVCMTMPAGLYTSTWADGYRLAHLDADLSLDPGLVRVASQAAGGVDEAMRGLAALKKPPTAFVVPDPHIAHTVLGAAKRAGIRLKERAVVLTGHEDVLSHLGLSLYPCVTEDSSAMADAAIRVLDLLRERKIPGKINLSVPFLSRNMD